MKVQQLFLRNVRGIRDLDLDFRDPVTGKPMSRIILAGANGSGKTTILESLFGLLAAAEKYGKGELSHYSTLGDVEIDLSSSAEMRMQFEIETDDGPSILSISYGGSPFSGETTVAEQAFVGGAIPRGRMIREIRTPIAEKSPLFSALAETIQSASKRDVQPLGSVLYFPHNRYFPTVLQGELSVELKPYQWAYRYQPSAEWKGSVESYLFSLNYLDLEDRDRKVSANRFGKTVELVNSILDGKKIARIEKGRVVIETDKGETHGLSDLSSGEKQIVFLLIEITRRIVPGSIILIDEPEIGLHSTWQRGLVVALDKIIEQYDAQVIMATHSPEIASMVLPYEVLFLSDLGLPLGEWKPEHEALP